MEGVSIAVPDERAGYGGCDFVIPVKTGISLLYDVR
jgi:hypothetical protein